MFLDDGLAGLRAMNEKSITVSMVGTALKSVSNGYDIHDSKVEEAGY